ncbi:MAG TPA: RHS repeat domain-containing protein, partial [Bacteroidales bacterium]|nr:RHS repeat domain-containing protein [Bacteroidales bacterium]
YTGYEYTTKILKRIDYKLGYVEFTYLSETYPNQILNKIQIFNKSSSTPLQTIKLLQTKYHNNPLQLNWYKLDSVEFYSSQNIFINKYKFEYNTKVPFPTINDNGSNETFSVDFWGFYNGATNENMLPSLTLPSWADYEGMRGKAVRKPNLIYTQAGILKKITFPEGGTVSFNYGLNKGTEQEDIGGLRIEKIVLKSGFNDSIVKSFSYFNPDYIPIRDEFFFSRNMTTDRSPGNCNNCVVETFTVSSSANFDFNIYGSPVVYGKVIEYFGNSNSNNGWIEHYYDHSFSHTTPDPIFNRFYNASFVDYLTTKMDWSTGERYLSWVKSGDILENETKTFDVSGKCREYVKRYYSHSLNEAFRNLNVKRAINHASSSCCSNSILKVGCFEMYTYNIAQLKQQLDSINTFVYTKNGAVKTTERFAYNNYSLLVQSEKQDSKGTLEILRTRYPSETNYSEMISKNMLAYPVEQISLKNGNVINSTLTLYKSNLNTYVPDKVYTLNISSSISSFSPFNGISRDSHYNVIPEITFDKHDESGNILQATGINGVITSYLWGYKQAYPVAKIEGADYTTASKAVDLSVLNNPSSDAVLRNELAKLRTALPNALITTYTYSPLIGMTSQTDPNGVTTYYEYDDFGRLKCVKDNNGKILKTYEYHYKN